MIKRINCWSGPRNVSTALMYSFAQRGDTQVVDEPLYACYLQRTGVDHPGKEQVLQSQSSNPDEVVEQVILGAYDTPVVYIKNMAHHMAGVDSDFLKKVTNIFLIREPRQMLPSLIKTIPYPEMRDTGYRMEYELFQKVREWGPEPIVLDSRELLTNPESVLASLCHKLELEFDPAMLEWEPGPRPEDGVWAEHWYDNVHRSSGFKPYREKNDPVPDRLENLLQQCNRYYREMYRYAIRA